LVEVEHDAQPVAVVVQQERRADSSSWLMGTLFSPGHYYGGPGPDFAGSF
jgi:hypothetical protein